MPDAGCQMPDTGCRMPDVEYQKKDDEYCVSSFEVRLCIINLSNYELSATSYELILPLTFEP